MAFSSILRGDYNPDMMEDDTMEDRAGVKLSPPVLALAFVWWYFYLEREHQRMLLFLVAFFKFAEYFYFLPKELVEYQEAPWFNLSTMKTVFITMGLFWSLAFLSSKLPPSKWTAYRFQHRGDGERRKSRSCDGRQPPQHEPIQ